MDIVGNSTEIINHIFQIYDVNQIGISFNGGKDNTVMLNLINSCVNVCNVKCFYFRTSNNQFDEIEEFILKSREKYNLDLITYNGTIKDCLYKIKQEYPDIKIIFMGTRQTDLSRKLEFIESTTSGWPEFTLINPIKDWKYSDVWNYLISGNIDYCDLYNKGYTSIGDKNNTMPNINLLKDGIYLHASELHDDSLERINRIKN